MYRKTRRLLLHPTERKIAIRPCSEYDTHYIRWRPDADKPIYSKTLNCQHFGNALYSIMEWNPDYMYRIRGTWAVRGNEQIIVFNLVNAVPAVTVSPDGGTGPSKRRVELCPDEWTDDFGDEFYEHVIENDFYYLAPNTEWQAQAESIPAPGIAQYDVPSAEEFQLSLDMLKRGAENADGQLSD